MMENYEVETTERSRMAENLIGTIGIYNIEQLASLKLENRAIVSQPLMLFFIPVPFLMPAS